LGVAGLSPIRCLLFQQRKQHPYMGRPRASAADRRIAMRIRERRMMRGLTQQQLGEMVGLPFRQLHQPRFRWLAI
jgi:hypothetical protein